MSTPFFDAVIIGAGAAGLFCAGQAGQRGLKVLLIDHADKVAEKIALEGRDWAEKVLRKEDMQIYVLRLLLEYGRVIADDRDKMGWVEDAKKDPSIEKTWQSFNM
mgnify:CR=1 FL=1